MNTIARVLLIVTASMLLSCGQSADVDPAVTIAARPPGVLIVSYADDKADTLPAPKVDSLSALAWLQIYSNTTGNDLSIRHHKFGELIFGIGPAYSGEGGDWVYQVNGEMATQAVDRQRVARTDTLTFIFK